MSPKSLIFSSDQETSRQLSQALTEFGFDVDECSEIFAAVEKITSHSYQVVAADWDDGVEASFLLKTARELKSNSEAFEIAVAKQEVLTAARRAGVDLVLSKPILPGQARQTLMGCAEFVERVRVLQPGFAEPNTLPNPYNQLLNPPPLVPKVNPPSFLKQRMISQPSPVVPIAEDNVVSLSEPVSPTIVPVSGDPFERSPLQTLFSSIPGESTRAPRVRNPRRFWRGAAFGLFFAALGIFLYGPVRSGALTSSVKQFYQAAREQTQSWLRSSDDKASRELALAKVPAQHDLSLLSQKVTRIDVGRAPNSGMPPEVTYGYDPSQPIQVLAEIGPMPVMPQLQPTPTAYTSGIPQSLRVPPQVVSVKDFGKPSPSLLASLEPVNVAEEMSEKLLVQKVQIIYPDQALRTGLQGTVVLQALIGKDGIVQDLKLIRGSLLLGQAAFASVRQWRYRPYFVNGRPVDTQTFVTVDFKLPSVARVSEPKP